MKVVMRARASVDVTVLADGVTAAVEECGRCGTQTIAVRDARTKSVALPCTFCAVPMGAREAPSNTIAPPSPPIGDKQGAPTSGEKRSGE